MSDKKELSTLERFILCAPRLQEIIDGNQEFLEMMIRCGIKIHYLIQVQDTIEFQKHTLRQFENYIKENSK